MPTSIQKFTLEKRHAFVEFLSRTGNVLRSAEAAGVTQSYVYRLRKKDPAFAEAWEEAESMAADGILAEARRRALGWDQPVFYRGKQVGSIKRYSDNMLALLLRFHMPEKYGSFAERRAGGREEMERQLDALNQRRKRERAKAGKAASENPGNQPLNASEK